ncbi:hypothetical protein BDY24DRAFT_415264 [Mrakia frigida]|uniref:uncharacterized protein n=1 Tax=Mrakia frigida TaxID=29902 RepID=UPI003FCC108D
MPKTLAPRRRLPWDVLLLVFKEADPSTLAVLGRVSYDFLAATSPDLYRNVVVTSVKQVEGLFCERLVVQAGRKTKIRTLAIDFSSLSPVPNSLSISSSRLDDERPIPLDYLEITLDYSKTGILSLLCARLFPRLDPERCSYEIVGRALRQNRWAEMNHQDTTQLLGWSRIQTVDIIGVFPFTVFNTRDHLVGLPSPFPAQRRVVRLHVASLLSLAYPDIDALVGNIGSHSRFWGLDGMQDRSVVLVVRTEEEKREAEAAVQTSVLIQRWRPAFASCLESFLSRSDAFLSFQLHATPSSTFALIFHHLLQLRTILPIPTSSSFPRRTIRQPQSQPLPSSSHVGWSLVSSRPGSVRLEKCSRVFINRSRKLESRRHRAGEICSDSLEDPASRLKVILS